MNLPTLHLSNLSSLAAIIIEQDNEKLSRCMQEFAKNKEIVQIVTNERSLPLYKQTAKTTYDSSKFDYTRGQTFLFDDCFEKDWTKDEKLRDFLSYPRMYGITSVFGFREFPNLTPRMCWNLDIICMGTNPCEETRKKLYESFFLHLLSYNVFCECLDAVTKDSGFLVLRREGTEDRIYRAYCSS